MENKLEFESINLFGLNKSVVFFPNSLFFTVGTRNIIKSLDTVKQGILADSIFKFVVSHKDKEFIDLKKGYILNYIDSDDLKLLGLKESQVVIFWPLFVYCCKIILSFMCINKEIYQGDVEILKLDTMSIDILEQGTYESTILGFDNQFNKKQVTNLIANILESLYLNKFDQDIYIVHLDTRKNQPITLLWELNERKTLLT